MDNPTTNQSNVSPDIKQRVVSLYAFMAKRLGIQQAPKITLTKDVANAKDPFGKTAYYDQQNKSVRLYITDRHPTDILRSFAHELIHHWQNEHGALPQEMKGGHAHYAQNDPVLRRREMEAYLIGNILFRDWQDENRYGPINENLQITNSHNLKIAIKNMLVQMIKNNTISTYHQDATSGDMKPEDFVDEMAMKIELTLEQLIDNVNNKGNKDGQPNVIPEMISRRQLKAFIKERIDEMGKNWDIVWDEEEPSNKQNSGWTSQGKRQVKKGQKGGEVNPKDDVGVKNYQQNYAQWLKQFLAHSHSRNKRAQKYYEIGFHSGEDHYTWYWNPDTKSVVYMKGKSHGENFGKTIPYENFRGRYDSRTKELSLTIPEFGPLQVTGDMKKDVPPELLVQLKKVFHNPKIFYFPFTV